MISGGGKLEIKYGMLFRGDIYILVFEQEFSIAMALNNHIFDMLMYWMAFNLVYLCL